MRPEINRSGESSRRRGTLAIELLLALPILLGVLLAMVEFSLLLAARQQVTIAVREGARIAAMGGGEPEVKQTLDRFLNNREAIFRVTLTRENGDPLQPGDPVEVALSVPTDSFVPEYLGFIGFSLRGTQIKARAVMLRE